MNNNIINVSKFLLEEYVSRTTEMNILFMMKNKVIVEAHIQWSLKSGTCSFWWDDWLEVGPLAYHRNLPPRLKSVTVSQFLKWKLG